VDDNPSLTVEELISYSSAKPVAIIGFCSTAQLIGGVFWDIPGIGISKLNEFAKKPAGSPHVALAKDWSIVKAGSVDTLTRLIL